MFSRQFVSVFSKPSISSSLLGRSFHTSLVISSGQTSFNNGSVTIENKEYDLSPFKLIPKSNLYATIKIFNKPYLITAGDKLTLPHNLKNVEIGSVIKFTDVISIGSRDHVFYPPNTPESKKALEGLLNIEGTVIEKTKNLARVKVTTKQRCRKDRKALVKHKKTVIRISDLDLNI